MTEEIKEKLDTLKNRAKILGVEFSPNIGYEKLATKVEAKIVEIDHIVAPKNATKAAASSKNESPAQRKQRLRNEASKLVRIRVTCMNPNKREWEGEFFSVGNSLVGFHKKYVPYNSADGWHVPNIIYKHLKDRKCQVFYTEKLSNGNKARKGKLIDELAIELLPALTGVEIQELARRQAEANRIG